MVYQATMMRKKPLPPEDQLNQYAKNIKKLWILILHDENNQSI